MKRATWAEIILGVWLAVSPFVVADGGVRPVAEDLIPGLFLCATSYWILAVKIAPLRVAWLQSLCGLALIIGSFVFVFSRLPHAAVNSLVVGLLVIAAYLGEASELITEQRQP